MSKPAYTEPDESGHFHLRVAGEGKTVAVEHDVEGYFLVEVLAWDSLPEPIRHQVEESRAHPETLVRMTLDDLED